MLYLLEETHTQTWESSLYSKLVILVQKWYMQATLTSPILVHKNVSEYSIVVKYYLIWSNYLTLPCNYTLNIWLNFHKSSITEWYWNCLVLSNNRHNWFSIYRHHFTIPALPAFLSIIRIPLKANANHGFTEDKKIKHWIPNRVGYSPSVCKGFWGSSIFSAFSMSMHTMN